MTTPGKIEKRFRGLEKKDVKKREITGLVSPDGKEWAGGQVNFGHTQGIDCWEDWLVLTNNQKVGPGYIALCKRNSDGNYEYVSHVKDLDRRKTLYSHPGGIQMFDNDDETWVVVPFEKDGYKVQTGVSKGLPTYYKKSEIRFYRIENGELKCREEITVKRKGRKAGSAGVARTGGPGKPFVLAVAYRENTVDFYRGDLEKGFKDSTFTLSASDERPPYVNAMSLLSCANDIYLVGLSGEDFKCTDVVYMSKIDFSNNDEKINDSLHVYLKSKLRLKWHGPSFRWGGGSGCLSDAKLSVVAVERMIHPEKEAEKKGRTKIAVLE